MFRQLAANLDLNILITKTWLLGLKKSSNEYLVYIRNKRINDASFKEDGFQGCGDVTFKFKKVNRVWLQYGGGLGAICVD